VLKLSLIVWLAWQIPDPLVWGLPVSILFGVCYLGSLGFTYWRVAQMRGARRHQGLSAAAAPAVARVGGSS
jgi:hypothetical protein